MTPNPTEGKLTEAQIEMLIAQGRDKEEANLSNVVMGLDDFKVLCDMALESLKAPAVTTGEANISEIIKALKKLPIEQAEVISGEHKGWEFTAVDWHEIQNVIFVIKRDYLSAPAPLSSEAVGKVREALLLGIANWEYTKPQSMRGQEDFNRYQQKYKCNAEALILMQNALALLTPSPSEKCGECGGKGRIFEGLDKAYPTKLCPTCQGKGHTKAPSLSEKPQPTSRETELR